MSFYPLPLQAVGGAHTGIAPVNLLDIMDVNGNVYLWADRKIIAPTAILVPTTAAALAAADVTAGPIPLPLHEELAWSLPTNWGFSMPGTKGSAAGNGAGGNLQLSGGDAQALGQWAGFKMPSIPAGVTIDSAYLVLNCTGTTGAESTDANMVCATNAGSMPTGGNFSGQYFSAIAGPITAAVIEAALISVSITNEIMGDVGYQEIDISFLGIAIYYTPLPVALSTSFSGSYESNGNLLYSPWLLSVPSFSFHRSLQTDSGSFVIQNVSGDSLSRDFEKLARVSALEGAMFIYRCWQPDAEAAWIEVHGTLTVGTVGVDTVQMKAKSLLDPAGLDTPHEIYCETCQLMWGGARCRSSETTECSYSFETCQVVQSPMMILNNYEKNYGEATANTAYNVINRRRKI
jgi:hypothetical protein